MPRDSKKVEAEKEKEPRLVLAGPEWWGSAYVEIKGRKVSLGLLLEDAGVYKHHITTIETILTSDWMIKNA